MNPPKSISGGATGFQEYPKHLYRADGSFLSVDDAAAEARARADGWFLSRADAAAPATVEDAPVKRGPGRPRTDDRG